MAPGVSAQATPGAIQPGGASALGGGAVTAGSCDIDNGGCGCAGCATPLRAAAALTGPISGVPASRSVPRHSPPRLCQTQRRWRSASAVLSISARPVRWVQALGNPPRSVMRKRPGAGSARSGGLIQSSLQSRQLRSVRRSALASISTPGSGGSARATTWPGAAGFSLLSSMPIRLPLSCSASGAWL